MLFGVSLVTFTILHAIPGDPVAIMAPADATEADIRAIRAEFGLDQPLPLQYVTYVANALHGDLGRSIRTRDPVLETLVGRLEFTVQLTLLSILWGIAL